MSFHWEKFDLSAQCDIVRTVIVYAHVCMYNIHSCTGHLPFHTCSLMKHSHTESLAIETDGPAMQKRYHGGTIIFY